MSAPLPSLAVLAGGLATRLGEVARDTPKSLVEVGGEPFLAHQLRLFRRQGWTRIVLLTGHLGEPIERFVASRDWGLAVETIRDSAGSAGPGPRGTGGAVRAALPRLGPRFAVTYGDAYLDEDPRPAWAAFLRSGRPALMVVLHNRGLGGASNAEFDGRLVTRHDKATHGLAWIDWGLSFFSVTAFDGWGATDPWDLSAITGHLAAHARLAGHATATRFHEIGGPAGLDATRLHLAVMAKPDAGSTHSRESSKS